MNLVVVQGARGQLGELVAFLAGIPHVVQHHCHVTVTILPLVFVNKAQHVTQLVNQDT